MQATALDPKERFPSATALANALQEVLQALAV
jgi:hypothetical protein